MELLLILTYSALCVAIFKLFDIPVNKWSLPTAALGGIFLIGAIMLLMNYNHPFTSNSRIYFATTPILPGVRGRVIDVPVIPNTPLQPGDVLFRVDPSLYQYAVDRKKAQLAEAQQNVRQLRAAYDQTAAATAKFKAQVSLAQQSYERQAQLFEKNVVAQATLDVATRNIDASKLTLAEAVAAEERARLAYSSEIGGKNTGVARLEAELQEAEYELEQTVVRAPTAGYVTQVALRPGVYAVPLPLRPAMVFIHSEDRYLAAGFRQNALQRVRVGDEAEVAVDAIPGQVFKGHVRAVLDAIAAGQLQATGTLQDMGAPSEGGRAVALITVQGDLSAYNVPGGAAAQVAVYTPFWHHFAIIRRILLRMRSWQNFVFMEGH
jgi:multidrug resistance efflux pump